MAIHFGISMDNHLVQPGHLDLLVLIRKLLGLADHLLDLFLGQSALVVGDGNLLRLSGASAVSQTGTGTVTGE